MKTQNQLIIALFCLGLAVNPGSLAAAAGTSGGSQAVTPELIDELAAEIERSMTTLALPGAPKPYFIGYKLTEVEVNDAVASLGATTSSRERHMVTLEAHVHVGSYKLDNSNFVVAQAEDTDGIVSRALPLEATPAIARRMAWLATDRAYKEALEQLTAKIEARRTGTSRNNVPSYSHHEPLVQEKDIKVAPLNAVEELEKRAERISQAFRNEKELRDSRVAFTSFLERRWYLNSDGSAATDTRRVTGVVVVATGQADDGQELARYYSQYGVTMSDLATDKELIRTAKELAKSIRALRRAPLMDNYTGPVLFEGQAAASIARYALAPHLGGTPVPEGLEQGQAKQFGGAFADRIGLRVISPILSVVDDPTKIGNRIGGYRFDDEGVPAQRVQVVKDGKLLTLLTSRTPSDKIAKSNGHARRNAPGGGFHGSTTNLEIIGKRGLHSKQLRRKLIGEAREQGLPYALVIREIDDAAITAAPDSSRRELLHLLKVSDDEAPPPALLAYRIYPNGRQELVRGLQLKPVATRSWRDVSAVGKSSATLNYLASAESNLVHKINGNDPGFVPSAGVESSITTPDLLFKELDIVRSVTGRRPLPAIAHPGG